MFALLACLLLAPAPTLAAGINLSWDDCGRAGKTDLAASCVETPVPYVMVGSVVPPAGLIKVNGFQAIIDIQVDGNSLPSWWEMGHGCRAGKISISFDFSSGPYTCEPVWEMAAMGGMNYTEHDPAGNRATISIIGAVPSPFERSMTPGTEYYLFKLNILKSGTMSCEGCRTPACIQLSEVRLTQPEPLDDAFLYDRADLNHVTWQGGIGSPDSDMNSCRADAVRNRSWGQVKSLYR